MALLSTEALVLRGYKLGETSKVVVLLTRERGKVRAVARGARGGRPRYQSALEPLSEVRVTLYGRQGADLLRLGQAELLHSAFRAGTRSLEAALFLSGCAELLDAFCPEGEAEEKVYRLALAVVLAAERGVSPDLLARYLEAWLLRLHGLFPPLDRCAGCGGALPAAGGLSYHQAAHGFVCPGCGPGSGPELSPEARAMAVGFLRQPPEALGSGAGAAARALEALHRDLIAAHLERDLRAPRVIREVGREAARR
jgi:DNA repair protein RecO (recombination protein O)